jgi:C-terminal processing protease CtpA/Prc
MLRSKWILFAALVMTLLALGGAVGAQDDLPTAEIVNDEGGAVVVRGEMEYTNTFFTAGVAEPLIILEDQTGFVERDLGYLFPPASQTLGQFTSDFFQSPVEYSISLPIEPQGNLNDVDNDSESDTGVQIFAVAYWTNTFGEPFLERRDLGGGGWSSAYASTEVDPITYEVEGGDLLIYAPDDVQGFPSGFGDDGLLFTEDDPIVVIPAGYTRVDLDTDPFTFDRSREVVIDTIEPETSALDDFSNLSYTEAFDAMVEKFRTEYAFTEYKELDWNALSDEFRPLVEAAEEAGDAEAFQLAIQGFTNSVPDGHVSASSQFLASIPPLAGGIGLALRELDDGRIIATYIVEGSPVDEAGVQLGAEITEINGMPIDEAVSALPGLNPPYSNPVVQRIEQVREVTRFEVGDEVELTFQNPDADAPETVTLTAIEESESRLVSRGYVYGEPQNPNVPVVFEFLDSGYGYVSISSFFDNTVLTIQNWEAFINLLNQYGVPGVIIDMRQNGGGSGFLADQMAGYFFTEDTVSGYTAFYDEETGEFVTQTQRPDMIYPPQESLQYTGEVVVLVGPACASACETFSKAMTINDRATIVGQYPTAGLGGSVEDFYMPEGITVRFTIGRGLDANEEIDIEGPGVAPTVRVPVDETTVFAPGDLVLDAAVSYLNEQLGFSNEPVEVTLIDGGEIAVGDSVEGEIAAGERTRYLFTAEEDATLTITISDPDGALDSYLRVYNTDEELIGENDDIELGVQINSVIDGLEVAAGESIIIEVGTYADQAEGAYTLEVVGE